jgi:hypothetical protein
MGQKIMDSAHHCTALVVVGLGKSQDNSNLTSLYYFKIASCSAMLRVFTPLYHIYNFLLDFFQITFTFTG